MFGSEDLIRIPFASGSATHDAHRSAPYRLWRPSYGQTQKSAIVALIGEYGGGRKDERELEVTSVVQLGGLFLLRISRIKSHLQR